jgi:hypothetical protein
LISQAHTSRVKKKANKKIETISSTQKSIKKTLQRSDGSHESKTKKKFELKIFRSVAKKKNRAAASL